MEWFCPSDDMLKVNVDAGFRVEMRAVLCGDIKYGLG